MDTWDFCPKYMVPRTKPPQASQAMSMNGWPFTAKPKVPYQRTFTVKLQGMSWYLNGDNTYDVATDPQYNAARLEQFYAAHGLWQSFMFPHPHLGLIECRFSTPLEVPEAIVNAGGLVDGFDAVLVEHNPGY